MKIGGMGGLEIVIILVVILIIFGPKNLPKLGKAVGKTLSNLRSGMNEGKKKEVDEPVAADGPAEETVAEKTVPVQIEGETEDVEFEDDAADDGVDNGDAEVAEVAEGAAADSADGALEDAAAEATQPKKVKRVVRKKVVSEEQAE